MTAETTSGVRLVRDDLFAGVPGVAHQSADADERADIVAGAPIALAASRCTGCGRVHFPAREQCPACGAPSQRIALDTRASLGACTAVLHPPPGGLVEVPYLVGVARFPEGISIMGVVTGATQTPPQDTPVDTVAMVLPDGRLTYAFRPAPTPQ